VLTSLLASKVAIAAVASTIVVGGTTAAAYAGALPAGLLDLAHQTIGAQASATEVADGDAQGDEDSVTDDPTDDTSADPTDDASASPTDDATAEPTDDSTADPTDTPKTGVGPDATGPAAFGLCNAWSHGGLSTNSVAYASLVKAAGAEGDLAAYCATVPHPGSASHPSGDETAPPADGKTHTSHGHQGGNAPAHKPAKHGHQHG
jgi:hypothetical protein